MSRLKARIPRLSVPAVLAIIAALTATSAGAQIYRCTEGETTVFSDVPCSESAEVHDTQGRLSVVNAAGNLDEITASNQAFLQQRLATLARQRERAAEQRREAQRQQRRQEAIEQAQRSRTIVGRLGNSGIGNLPNLTPDRRSQASQQRSERDDERAQRRTLLSRSGGNQRNILR